MEEDQMVEPLMQRVAEWLEGTETLEQLERARAASATDLLPGPLLVQVDVLELAATDPELAQLLYDSPERFRQLVNDVLVAAGKLHAAERLWLRPSGLLAESHSCTQALELLRVCPGCTVAVHGVCCAASAIFQHRYSRTYVCGGCGAEAVVLEGHSAPSCCGPAFITENPSKAVTMQSQVIYLAEESTACGGTQLGEPTFAVMLHDDLCGRARAGDPLLVLGAGRHMVSLDASSAQAGCRPTIQVEALCIEVLPPLGPIPAPRCITLVQRPPASLAGLDSVLGAFGCCFDAPCSQLLRLALLLSAASAGVQPAQLSQPALEDDDADGSELLPWQRACMQSRAQVNVLLLTSGHEPHLQRLLQQAALGLCRQSVAGSADGKQLLPQLFAKFVEPSLQLQIPLAMGGRLAQASSGVLLLHSSQLSGKQGAALAACLRAGSTPLTPNMPELAVRLTPTMWCLAEDQDLGKPSSKGSLGRGQPGAVSARVTAKYGGHFLPMFDVLLDCGGEDDEEAIDLWAEQLLCTAQRQQGGMQAAGSSQGAGEHEAVAQVERAALAALHAHLQQAVARPQPCMTEEAMALLSAYFSLIRVAEESPRGVLESLARLATACARLCHRRQVLEFPDAVVAVMFMEEQLIARGGFANHWSKWRAELSRGTDLAVCLEGLQGSLQDSLMLALGGAEE